MLNLPKKRKPDASPQPVDAAAGRPDERADIFEAMNATARLLSRQMASGDFRGALTQAQGWRTDVLRDGIEVSLAPEQASGALMTGHVAVLQIGRITALELAFVAVSGALKSCFAADVEWHHDGDTVICTHALPGGTCIAIRCAPGRIDPPFSKQTLDGAILTVQAFCRS